MPRVWIALFFGYNGDGYNGMQHQKQPHVVPVQNQLIPLLYKGGFLPTDNYTELQFKQKYSRAARTDKGVHAVMNGISCGFTIDARFFDQTNVLNKNQLHLQLKQLFQDSKITYHCFKRVTTRFEMRTLIQSRRYTYICPITYFQMKQKSSQQIIQKINKCAQQFIGTHNYHNYTRKLKYKDGQSRRYILNFTAQIFKQKFIKFEIYGQSFLYNQIRKMIGAIIFVFINQYASQFISNTFFKNQFWIPIAPPNGLYLKTVQFTGYNKRKQIPQKLQFQDQLTVKSTKQLQGQIQQFIMKTSQETWDQWYQLVKEGKLKSIQQNQPDNQMEKQQ